MIWVVQQNLLFCRWMPRPTHTSPEVPAVRILEQFNVGFICMPARLRAPKALSPVITFEYSLLDLGPRELVSFYLGFFFPFLVFAALFLPFAAPFLDFAPPFGFFGPLGGPGFPPPGGMPISGPGMLFLLFRLGARSFVKRK